MIRQRDTAAGDAPRDAPDGLGPAGVAAVRDDGPIARFAGAVVRGQLVPLPPAVAGLTATVLLATLGLHGLAAWSCSPRWPRCCSPHRAPRIRTTGRWTG